MSQEAGHKPAAEADLLTNTQTVQDPALIGEEAQVGHDVINPPKKGLLKGKIKVKVILSV